MTSNRPDPRPALGLRPIINVSGTMTSLGASIAVPAAVEAMSRILPEFVDINDLQRKASAVIARLTGGEAGYVTASASAGITLSVAGCMTGADLARLEQLPDPTRMKDEVAIMTGHLVGYGAPVEQAIRLAGATVVPVGQATGVRAYQLEGKLSERTVAALYVISHHAVQYGQIPLAEFCRICNARRVPVVVDAASEYDLKGFLAAGAALAVYSAHKFLGGPTGGLVAGRKDLVRAAFLQNSGIGRGMKVGKETVLGAMAALEAWEMRDHAAVQAREQGYLVFWLDRLRDVRGLAARIVPDPTDNPLDRLEISIDPREAGTTAAMLAANLARGDPPVIVRDHEVANGRFYLDPCNLHPGEAEVVADRITDTFKRLRDGPVEALGDLEAQRFKALTQWPD